MLMPLQQALICTSDEKVAMGPIWDFNGALGNPGVEGWLTEGWHMRILSSQQIIQTLIGVMSDSLRMLHLWHGTVPVDGT